MKNVVRLIELIAAVVFLMSCSSSGEETFEFPDPVKFDFNNATFDTDSAIITNPYLAFTVGRKTAFEGETDEGLERIDIEVLAETKMILGVECAIVLDRVTVDGTLAEETWDWYAQDTSGTVWYMGESSNDYEDGELVSTEGSWEAGLDVADIGSIAEAGIQMFANPQVGAVYHQEFYEGEAVDAAEVVDLAASVTLSDGSQYTALKVKEWEPNDPTGFEYKYFVENVGLILETDEEDEEPIELVSQQD